MTDFRPPLAGRVAVVTGGNRGIGRGIALAMAGAGASVAISARDEGSLEVVAREVRGLGAECLATACDVSDEGSVAALGAAVSERFGRVDVVIANAGVAGPTKAMHELDLTEWRECLAIDLDGVFLTFRRFIPTMVRARAGSLVAISSITGKRALAGRTPYAAAKMGVIGLCRTLAAEVGPHGIRVNAVCPGGVSGPRIDEVFRNQARIQGVSEQEARRQFTDSAPLRRLVDADEVARTCVFLASDAASGITGEDINVAAGLVMY